MSSLFFKFCVGGVVPLFGRPVPGGAGGLHGHPVQHVRPGRGQRGQLTNEGSGYKTAKNITANPTKRRKQNGEYYKTTT